MLDRRWRRPCRPLPRPLPTFLPGVCSPGHRDRQTPDPDQPEAEPRRTRTSPLQPILRPRYAQGRSPVGGHASEPSVSTVHIAVVSTRSSAPLARATVRRTAHAVPSARAHVLDVDGNYVPVGPERVLTPTDVGLTDAELHRRATLHEPADVVRSLYPALGRRGQDVAHESGV